MKPFDFNVHPKIGSSGLAKSDTDAAVMSELTCSASQVIASFEYQFKLSSWSDYISGFNCMIFTSFFHEFPEESFDFTQRMNQLCGINDLSVEFTFLANPLLADSFERIVSYWAQAGVKFIKFHSYHQRFRKTRYQAV